MRRLLVPIAILAVIATACSLQLGGDQGSSGGRESLAPVSERDTQQLLRPTSVEEVVSRVLPAVVNVTTDVYQPGPDGTTEQGQGVGTGFIVRSDGIVVTNCHVVEGGSRISVFTSDENPTRYDARVVGGDCLHDLAVLQIQGAENLPTVSLGDSSSLKLGQPVVALGYALALEGGPTVTNGIVSSLDRTIKVQDPNCSVCGDSRTRTYSDVIQTDAAINHGNSGGPLVDLAGRVVGINSAGSEGAENIGFSIAIDSAKTAIREAVQDPLAPTAYLGVTTEQVTSDLAFQLDLPVEHGAVVVGTLEDGPAAGAGIAQGDVIVGVDGQSVSTPDELGSILDSLRPNQSVPVELVTSAGDHKTIDVTLGTRPLPVNLP